MSPYLVPQCGQGSGYDDSDIEAVTRLLRSDAHLSSGEEVAALEREFAQRTGTRHAVAVTSCTMALQLVTRVLDLEPGDEVIATPLTFQATVAPLLDRPVTVRFADISPETLCLDVDSVEAPDHPADTRRLHDALRRPMRRPREAVGSNQAARHRAGGGLRSRSRRELPRPQCRRLGRYGVLELPFAEEHFHAGTRRHGHVERR